MTLCDSIQCMGLLCTWSFSRQEYWRGFPFPPSGDLPNAGIERQFLHCRQILYHWATGEAYYIDTCMHVCCCWCVAKSCLTLCDSMDLLQHAGPPCPSPAPRVCSNSCLLSRWCHPTISSSVAPFSFCPQSFPESMSFPESWLPTSGGQSIGVSASASVLPMNIQGWFPIGLGGLISLPSKGLSKVLSRTTIQKHQFFGAQPFLWSNSHLHMTTGKTIGLTIWTFVPKVSDF